MGLVADEHLDFTLVSLRSRRPVAEPHQAGSIDPDAPAAIACGTSSWRMHALLWPPPISTSGGIALLHSSWTSGQRDAR